MGYSKSDTKYSPEIACSEQHLGCYKLNLEQSPHIPYGQNRRLEWDWEELSVSLRRFREKRGMGGNYHSNVLSANLKQISSGTPTSNWLQVTIDRPEIPEGGKTNIGKMG